MTAPDKITLERIVEAINAGQAIVCLTQCWSCQVGQHQKPKRWHPWADEDDVAHAAATGQQDPSGQRCGCPCADRLPIVQRPNGKLYRPRSLRVVGWDREDYHTEVAQLAVLGTHDVDVARDRAQCGFRSPYLVKPELGWVRLGMCRGEPTWVHDEVRGAACVIFDESDDPPDLEGGVGSWPQPDCSGASSSSSRCRWRAM